MVSRGVTRHILLPDKRMNILPWPRISMSGHGTVFFAIALASYPYYAAGALLFLQRRITNPPFDQTPITQRPLAPGAILRCHPLARMH